MVKKQITILAFLFLLTLPYRATEPPTYTKADLLGKINPAKHTDFAHLKSKYTNRSDSYLRKEVYKAFKSMWKDAHKEGITLTVISATRNQSRQAAIWNRKWNSFGGDVYDRAERILQYSSMPGTSRHHWGTDFDLNALENSYFESGEGLAVYNWLSQNAHKYGFFQPYTEFNSFRDAGYREEKWHWSYYPLAQKFQRAYNQLVNYDDLNGFEGNSYAKDLEVINNYVNGIEVPEKLWINKEF